LEEDRVEKEEQGRLDFALENPCLEKEGQRMLWRENDRGRKDLARER
jgi:hypothetical protein